MKGTRAAIRYAKAILNLAKDNNSAEKVNGDMEGISKTIAGSPDLQNVLSSPVIKTDIKRNALREIFKGADAVTLGSFDILLENNRIYMLRAVARKYVELYNETNNIQLAVVTTAVPLNAPLEKKVLAKVEELTGNSASLKNIVDPTIIGGFILRMGDLQYNASVANNLSNLEREFKNNTYNSKI